MAKRRILAGGLILFLLLRLFPGFAVFWGRHLSLPVLDLLAGLGSHAPFVLLEYLALAAAASLVWACIRRRLLKRLAGLALSLLAAYVGLWYPLYFTEQPLHHASTGQLAALCGSLIDELNTSLADFSVLPSLPAKLARFPGWMDALGISGLCSFFTGEAILSPDQHPAALPFTAVHEQMHLSGIAGEGAANIAAYESCMLRGGVFADSARLWALRCGMGMLREADRNLYSETLLRMNARTRRLLMECGGMYRPAEPSPLLAAAYSFLGIAERTQDYEILVPYLAAGFAE